MADKNQLIKKQRKKIKFHVDSKYSILETIGSGAYGVVCSAVDNTNGQRVAIKKISNVFDVPSITKRTLRELKILKHFKHDNIISIKEILRPPEDLSDFSDVYIVLDLMGSDLHHIIHSKQELSIEHIRYFLYQLLRGLKYIHSANIIHRDLKPSNLLINKDCELKIGDFGMARSLSASASEKKRVMTEYVATRWYRAPELMLSLHQFTKAIDVWSVGCIFAEMMGRTPLFPGSNYLNQLQLILSVVGIPTIEFMATITSEKIRNYIGRLPHKEAVPFSKFYPEASADTLDLLGKFLVLDPKMRCSVETALGHAFLEKYHDLDDEPTCSMFAHDIESIPLDRNILRSHILKEIKEYHTKRPKPKLTPLETKFLQPFLTPGNNNMKNGKLNKESIQHESEVIQVDPKLESRKGKRKQVTGVTNIISTVVTTKKKPIETTDSTVNSLSDKDKEILERWKNMQKRTKPFVHPIRKHMEDLKKLQTQTTVIPKTGEETAKGQPIVDRVSGLQFTNFVAQNKNGLVSLVREQTVRLPNSKIVTGSVKDDDVKQNQTIKDSTSQVTKLPISQIVQNKNILPSPSNRPTNKPIASQQQQQQTILVPLGSLPVFQLHNGPIVFLPKFSPAQKVNIPIPIAPKPPAVTTSTSVTLVNVGSSSHGLIVPSTQSSFVNTQVSTQDTTSVLSTACDHTETIVNKPIQDNSSARSSSSGDRSQYGLCSSDGKSSTLVSANSIFSEISINSSELNSSEHNNESASLCEKHSSITEENVLAEIKKLDKRDQEIVSLIENLAEQKKEISESNKTLVSRDQPLNNNNNNIEEKEVSPVTTLANSDTNSWSIVKNMLVNAIKAKKEKDENNLPNSNIQILPYNSAAPQNSISGDNLQNVIHVLPQSFSSYSNTNTASIDSPELFVMTSSSQNENKNTIFSSPTSKVGNNFEPVSPTSNVQNNFDHILPTAAVAQNISGSISQTSKLQNNLQTIGLPIQQNDLSNLEKSQKLFVDVSNQPSNSITLENNEPLNNILSTNETVSCGEINIENKQNLETVTNDNNKHFDWLNILTNQNDDEWTNIIPYPNEGTNLDFNLINSLALEFPNHGNYLKTPKSATVNFPPDHMIDFTKDNEVTVLVTPRIGKSETDSPLNHLDLGKSLSTPTNQIRYASEREKDVFLTTLVDTPKTPRSGAAAYGLGMNLEDLFTGPNIDSSPMKGVSNVKQTTFVKTVISDQTPLSASLLNDWLDGNEIEPFDIVDLQRELETNSTSLLFDK